MNVRHPWGQVNDQVKILAVITLLKCINNTAVYNDWTTKKTLYSESCKWPVNQFSKKNLSQQTESISATLSSHFICLHLILKLRYIFLLNTKFIAWKKVMVLFTFKILLILFVCTWSLDHFVYYICNIY